jgi:hypothetical protein
MDRSVEYEAIYQICLDWHWKKLQSLQNSSYIINILMEAD